MNVDQILHVRNIILGAQASEPFTFWQEAHVNLPKRIYAVLTKRKRVRPRLGYFSMTYRWNQNAKF